MKTVTNKSVFFNMLGRVGRITKSIGAIRSFSSRSAIMTDALSAQLDDIKAAGTYKSERVITSAQRAEISVNTSTEPVLNFCANNYLGLSANPDLIQSAKDALDSHGLGRSWST